MVNFIDCFLCVLPFHWINPSLSQKHKENIYFFNFKVLPFTLSLIHCIYLIQWYLFLAIPLPHKLNFFVKINNGIALNIYMKFERTDIFSS